MTKALVATQVRMTKSLESLADRRDRGQGTLEYVGMIAVAAVIIVAVIGVLRGADLGTWVGTFITNVKNSVGA